MNQRDAFLRHLGAWIEGVDTLPSDKEEARNRFAANLDSLLAEHAKEKDAKIEGLERDVAYFKELAYPVGEWEELLAPVEKLYPGGKGNTEDEIEGAVCAMEDICNKARNIQAELDEARKALEEIGFSLPPGDGRQHAKNVIYRLWAAERSREAPGPEAPGGEA